MRRIIPLLLITALLLTACIGANDPSNMEQPVYFYYRTATVDFSSEDGVICAEIRDLGDRGVSDRELFEQYFGGPIHSDLISPFTQDTEFFGASRRGGTLEIELIRNKSTPEEFEHSLAYACIAKTGLALDGVRKVRILVRTGDGVLEDDVLLSEKDLLLYDSGLISQDTVDVNLYYMDETGSFLLTEKRTIPAMSQNALPKAVLELLLSPPQNGGMRMPLPPGSAILDVNVEHGICSVDFNSDFYTNRSEDEQTERLTILSVVNTLCELDGINQVQFYSRGALLYRYGGLDLSTPWIMDSSVVGPIREELGEFPGILYLPCEGDGLLHRLTVRARARGGATQEEALMQSLFSRESQNCLSAPCLGLPAPMSVTTSRGICRVVLVPDSFPKDHYSQIMVTRSITATLCTLPQVSAVVIMEGDDYLTPGSVTPSDEWYALSSAPQIKPPA